MTNFTCDLDNSERIAAQQQRQNAAERDRLIALGIAKTPKVGNHVLISLGLVGRGLPYQLGEGTVIETAGELSRLEINMHGYKSQHWVENVLIREVLHPKGGE